MSLTRKAWLFTIAAIAIAAACRAAETPESQLNRLIRPYSTQQIIELNVNESYTFKLKNGVDRVIRLVSAHDHRDSVINFVRRSDVRVEINGRPLDLVAMPYVMPTETAGLRIQADTTSGYGNISKQAQLSLWDATEPIVDAKRFVFPLRDFRFLSHGTQAYNEPVHLGAGDDDPTGQRFYHDYGFDMGGFEGGHTVLSPVDGKIVHFWPSREDLCSAVVQDANGLNWELAHLNSVGAAIVIGKQVKAGQPIGTLGKNGPSGNFSHLHTGTYLTKHDLDVDNRNRKLNLYPWFVAAYQARCPKGLAAVARPHHIALAGEKVVLDGSNSLAWGGSKIVQWRWILSDGRKIEQAKAETAFDRPGAYVASLWVKDDVGNEDVDFCQIKVYTKEKPEKGIPHIYMTCTPTEDIRPDQAVRLRFWPQGTVVGPINVAFDDGTNVEDYRPYSKLSHPFKTPGIHIVTARCENNGTPIEQKLKVVVSPAKMAPE
jgi:murein DD-endopeptidase MepM/ murein hydrolase activator NlpD